MASKAQIVLTIHDTHRGLIMPDKDILVSVRAVDNSTPTRKSVRANRIELEVPFRNTGADRYAIALACDGRKDAGYFPVAVDPDKPCEIKVMLLPKRSESLFPAWEALKSGWPEFHQFIAGDNEEQARQNYENLQKTDPMCLLCLFNLAKAIDLVSRHLQDESLLALFRSVELIRSPAVGRGLRQDRMWAYASPRLEALLEEYTGGPNPTFGHENPALHANADVSFKELRFGQANLQFSIARSIRHPVHQDCVRVDVDVDYYQDRGAHFLLEVLPNTVSRWVQKPMFTDPVNIYAMRWTEGSNCPAVEQFDPPYRLRALDERRDATIRARAGSQAT
jgi:hypothetical protein